MLQWLQVNYSNTHTPYVYTTWLNTQYGCHDRSWMHFPMCCVSLQCARVVMCCHGVIFIEVDGSACSWHSASLGVVIVSVLYFCLTPPPSSPERSCTSCSILERSLSSQIWNHQPLNQNRVSLLWSCVHMRERERENWLTDGLCFTTGQMDMSTVTQQKEESRKILREWVWLKHHNYVSTHKVNSFSIPLHTPGIFVRLGFLTMFWRPGSQR